MLSFLFWNVNRRSIPETIAQLARESSSDFVILAESGAPTGQMLQSLNAGGAGFSLPWSSCSRIQLFCSLPSSFVQTIDETNALTARRITLPGVAPFLLVAAHTTSKLHTSTESQQQAITQLANFVIRQENVEGHGRTVLVGDLNMNPFEPGIAGAAGLHAVMSRDRARKSSRRIDGIDYPYFYNPMWGWFGDRSPGPPGTYHFMRAEHVTYFWNVFDQVLVRPSLLDAFRSEDVQVLTTVGDQSLLTSAGLPDSRFSDHLPLVFRLSV